MYGREGPKDSFCSTKSDCESLVSHAPTTQPQPGPTLAPTVTPGNPTKSPVTSPPSLKPVVTPVGQPTSSPSDSPVALKEYPATGQPTKAPTKAQCGISFVCGNENGQFQFGRCFVNEGGHKAVSYTHLTLPTKA